MTLTEHFKQEERIATDRGAADFFAGRHLNPYSWSKEGNLFRAWIEGYKAAKDISKLEQQNKETS